MLSRNSYGVGGGGGLGGCGGGGGGGGDVGAGGFSPNMLSMKYNLHICIQHKNSQKYYLIKNLIHISSVTITQNVI